MAAITQLLLLACTAGVWLVEAQTTCTEAGKRSCFNCAIVSLCDAADDGTLSESLSGCSVGQVCDDSLGIAACFLPASAPSGAQCKCQGPGKMADPIDPSWYILCMAGGSQYSIKCPDDQVFEETTGNCITAPPTVPTTTMAPLECTALPGPVVVPDTGCKSYYACIPLDPTDPTKLSPTEAQQCTGCQLYDISLGTCVDQTFTCEGKGDGAIADTINCTIYHTCLGGTELGEVINCKSDEIFDGQNGKCVTGDMTDSAIAAILCPPISLCIDSTTICSGLNVALNAQHHNNSTSIKPSSSSSDSYNSASPGNSSDSDTPNSSSSSSSSSFDSSDSTFFGKTTAGIPDCSADGPQPFPEDCTKYYYCFGGKPVLQKCPGITLFDSASKLCVLPAEATGCN